ncbi:MAG TPA: hypothetical protein VF798_12530 [Burkholderiaceae bacterium]
MTLLGKLCAAMLALSLAGSALAAATLHDVEIAVKTNHDYAKGEKLMRDVVAGDPNNARYHYIFAQILDKNGKHDEALREFNQMKQLDPSYSFEKDPSRVQVFGDKLANEGARAAPAQIAPVTPAPAYTPRAETHIAPPAPAPDVPHKSGHTMLWVVLGLIVLGIAGWFLFRRMAAKDQQEDEARVKALRQEQLKQANALLESVKPLRLDMRMASPPNTALLAELDDAEKSLIGLIERLSKTPVPQREVDAQSDKLASLRRRFEGKAEPAPQAEPEPLNNNSSQSVYQGSQQNTGFGMPQQVNAGMSAGANTVYQPAGYPQQYPPQMMQQPMYVEPDSGLGTVGGLIAGVALGEMMAGGHRHDREIIREVHEVREVPVYEDRPSRDDSSDIDFGDDNSGSSGDVDFGSDDT